MKFSLGPAVLGIVLSFAGSITAKTLDKPTESTGSGKLERSIPVDPNASITLCVMSGKLTVRGWDKSEVRVRSTDADQLDFRRVDKIKIKDPTSLPTRLDVMVVDSQSAKGDCQALADVEMDMPKGGTVQVQTRDGDISITAVGGVYAGSQNGDIVIDHAGKFVEAGSVGGSIYLKDSTGRVNLSSAGGGVEVKNVRASATDDTFEVGTVSGDIQLDGVANRKVLAKTVNGTLTMTGPLVRAGYYGFTTMGGDILLMMPADASFTLNARVSEKGDIVSEFPLKYMPEPPAPATAQPQPKPAPEPPAKKPEKVAPKGAGPKTGPVIAPIVVVKPVVVNPFRRVSAICGGGDATISISSFGGTVHLKKM